MIEKEIESIRVDRGLYLRLRNHCDSENLRFIDFVENSLEDALEKETVIKALEDEIERLRKKDVKYDYAFNRGFQQGFAFLYLLCNGLNASGVSEEELQIVRRFPAEAPKGEQIKLF